MYDYYSDDIYNDVDDFLEHHGVKGMKWGVRHDRKSSKGTSSSSGKSKEGQSWFQRNKKKIAVTAVSVAAAGTAAVLGYKYMKTYKPRELREMTRGIKKASRNVTKGVKKAKRNVTKGVKKAKHNVTRGVRKAKRNVAKTAIKTYITARHIKKRGKQTKSKVHNSIAYINRNRKDKDKTNQKAYSQANKRMKNLKKAYDVMVYLNNKHKDKDKDNTNQESYSQSNQRMRDLRKAYNSTVRSNNKRKNKDEDEEKKTNQKAYSQANKRMKNLRKAYQNTI